ncbi:MAG: succinate dehydrogenase, cytochrome b556 subunit [Rhodospirillales bacterium]|jgi:succinate dehydrogenase / fumarate reductase cytochrome b subunit|nr:succinate dehydrogenase, cytochrome b556 subunit [Rhodospirillales bacterium]
MIPGNRPLSPHLQVYKFKITMAVSILQRITGSGLAVGLLVFTYWLAAAAYGPDAYATAQAFLTSWIGYLLLLGFTVALYFHLCNGIRHLFWDIGWGFEMEATTASSVAIIVGTVVLTALTWIIGLSG